MITPAALREISRLQHEAEQILNQRSVSKLDQKRADLLIAKIANIRQAGYSSDEQRQLVGAEIHRELFDSTPEQRAHERLFHRFLAGASDSELEAEARSETLLKAGQQATVFSAGPAGGVLVPMKFAQQVAEGRAAVDPLFDESIVTLIQETGFNLGPLTIPGWDLTGVAATKVSETEQHEDDAIPAIDSRLLNRYTYRAQFTGTLEFQEDSQAYGSAEAALARVMGVSFGRGVGVDLVNGDGVTGPQGILSGSVDSGITTAAAGKLGLTDFTRIFYSVNLAYRNAPKAAWLVGEATHKMITESVDDAGRPLFPIVDGVVRILGKPCYLCPSIPTAAGSKGICFGDLSHFYVHSSSLLIRRKLQVPGLCEYGKVAWLGLQMVDAVVHDPTEGANSGALSPIKYATLHS